VFRDIAKRNYELETAKYLMQGKRTRENPLLEGLGAGGGAGQNQNDDNAGGANGGFGSQQQF